MLKANEAMDHKKKVISLVEDYHLECIGDDLLNIPEHCFPKIPVTVTKLETIEPFLIDKFVAHTFICMCCQAVGIQSCCDSPMHQEYVDDSDDFESSSDPEEPESDMRGPFYKHLSNLVKSKMTIRNLHYILSETPDSSSDSSFSMLSSPVYIESMSMTDMKTKTFPPVITMLSKPTAHEEKEFLSKTPEIQSTGLTRVLKQFDKLQREYEEDKDINISDRILELMVRHQDAALSFKTGNAINQSYSPNVSIHTSSFIRLHNSLNQTIFRNNRDVRARLLTDIETALKSDPDARFDVRSIHPLIQTSENAQYITKIFRELQIINPEIKKTTDSINKKQKLSTPALCSKHQHSKYRRPRRSSFHTAVPSSQALDVLPRSFNIVDRMNRAVHQQDLYPVDEIRPSNVAKSLLLTPDAKHNYTSIPILCPEKKEDYTVSFEIYQLLLKKMRADQIEQYIKQQYTFVTNVFIETEPEFRTTFPHSSPSVADVSVRVGDVIQVATTSSAQHTSGSWFAAKIIDTLRYLSNYDQGNSNSSYYCTSESDLKAANAFRVHLYSYNYSENEALMDDPQWYTPMITDTVVLVAHQMESLLPAIGVANLMWRLLPHAWSSLRVGDIVNVRMTGRNGRETSDAMVTHLFGHRKEKNLQKDENKMGYSLSKNKNHLTQSNVGCKYRVEEVQIMYLQDCTIERVVGVELIAGKLERVGCEMLDDTMEILTRVDNEDRRSHRQPKFIFYWLDKHISDEINSLNENEKKNHVKHYLKMPYLMIQEQAVYSSRSDVDDNFINNLIEIRNKTFIQSYYPFHFRDSSKLPFDIIENSVVDMESLPEFQEWKTHQFMQASIAESRKSPLSSSVTKSNRITNLRINKDLKLHNQIASEDSSFSSDDDENSSSTTSERTSKNNFRHFILRPEEDDNFALPDPIYEGFGQLNQAPIPASDAPTIDALLREDDSDEDEEELEGGISLNLAKERELLLSLNKKQ